MQTFLRFNCCLRFLGDNIQCNKCAPPYFSYLFLVFPLILGEGGELMQKKRQSRRQGGEKMEYFSSGHLVSPRLVYMQKLSVSIYEVNEMLSLVVSLAVLVTHATGCIHPNYACKEGVSCVANGYIISGTYIALQEISPVTVDQCITNCTWKAVKESALVYFYSNVCSLFTWYRTLIVIRFRQVAYA